MILQSLSFLFLFSQFDLTQISSDLKPLVDLSKIRQEGENLPLSGFGRGTESQRFTAWGRIIVSDRGNALIRASDPRSSIYIRPGLPFETPSDLVEYILYKGPPVRLVVRMEWTGDPVSEKYRLFPREPRWNGLIPTFLYKFWLGDIYSEICLGAAAPDPDPRLRHPTGTGYLLAGSVDVYARRTFWSCFTPFNSDKWAYWPLAVSCVELKGGMRDFYAVFRKAGKQSNALAIEIYKFAFKLVEDSLQADFVYANSIPLPDSKGNQTAYYPNPTPMDVTTFVDVLNQKLLIAPTRDNNPMLLIDKAGKRTEYPLERGLFADLGPSASQKIDYVYLYNGKPVISVLGDVRGKTLSEKKPEIRIYDSPTHHSTIPGYALIGHSANGKYLLIARAADETYWVVKVK